MKRQQWVPPFAMLGWILLGLGLACFVMLSVLYIPVSIGFPATRGFFQSAVWYSGAPVFAGLSLILVDLLTVYRLRRRSLVPVEEVNPGDVTVVLTAFNDEESIGNAVKDFATQPMVKRVVVIDNNSNDSTARQAQAAGAEVVVEHLSGYGHCVWRALATGATFDDTKFVVLSEGDGTFAGADVTKLLAYVQHADIVAGTRISDVLRAQQTQLTTFMFWGNFFAAKLLEAKHLGRVTLSDLGTTFKLIRSATLREHLDNYDPKVNLEFNAHFLDVSLQRGLRIVEIPLTFLPRVGHSKGGNVSNLRALKVGLRMIVGIVLSWKILIGK